MSRRDSPCARISSKMTKQTLALSQCNIMFCCHSANVIHILSPCMCLSDATFSIGAFRTVRVELRVNLVNTLSKPCPKTLAFRDRETC
eukprot:2412427-Amphidinium_carterae.3